MPQEIQELAAPTTKTLVMLDGGHTTLVKGYAPTDLEHQLNEAMEDGVRFVYLQHHPDASNARANAVCVDPRHVVALMRVDPS